MTVQPALPASGPETVPLSLEGVELELAISLQNLTEHGFDGALSRALEPLGGAILFQFPAGEDLQFQRVAAVAIRDGGEARVLIVTLSRDGEAIKVGDSDGGLAPFAGLAASFTGVMAKLEKLNS